MNPLQLFEKWLSEELKHSQESIPTACCLSTIGLDGYPNARFVSLKEIVNDSFVITGPMDARKGLEAVNCPKASLTFWWTSTKKQVRIQGDVTDISKTEADRYFEERSRDSQIVSSIFEQGKEIRNIAHLKDYFSEERDALENKPLKRPENWGGFYIKPIRIEFMEFKKNRLHERTLFRQSDNQWEASVLQP